MNNIIEESICRAYFNLLTSLNWKDDVLIRGLREGLNKFLSNAWLQLVPGRSKYHKTHLASENAIAAMRSGEKCRLCFEHVVPKAAVLQGPCEERARRGILDYDFVLELFQQYWLLATITEQENTRLQARQMPDGWIDGDLLARYREAGLRLTSNPFYYDQLGAQRVLSAAMRP